MLLKVCVDAGSMGLSVAGDDNIVVWVSVVPPVLLLLQTICVYAMNCRL